MRILIVIGVLCAFASFVEAREERFQYPEVHNDFCGSHMDYRVCKCARHNEMCDAIGMDKNAAREKLQTAFDSFIKTQIDVFARSCMNGGGIYSVIRVACEYCEDGKVRDGGVCKSPRDVGASIEEIYNLPKVETVGGSQNIGYVDHGEGEFFVYSPGRGKWIGPIHGGGLQLFQGDVLYTTAYGRARLRFGSANFYLLERSMLRLPSPQQERTLLERGALFIWETIKRIGTNDMLEIEEGGAHSITGRKGTAYLIESNEGGATYMVEDGAIEVWTKNNPSRQEISSGNAVKFSEAGSESVPYEWDARLSAYGLSADDFSEPAERQTFAPIDPDAIHPTEAAYTGDLTKNMKKSRSGGFGTSDLVSVLIAIALGYFISKRFLIGKDTKTS